MRAIRHMVPVAAALALSGCEWLPRMLRPVAEQGGEISRLWWIFFWTTLAVYVLVVGATIVAVVRGRRRRHADIVPADADSERRRTIVVVGATVLTVVILTALLLFDFSTSSRLESVSGIAMRINVTGHQWWWSVDYEDSLSHRILSTANEIHVPVGRMVELRLHSADVIHSFWVPRITGKMDLVPGMANKLHLKVNTPGTYFGQCAEFCGYQHAHMGLLLVAESPEQFSRWIAAQSQPALPPSDALASRGLEVFLSSPCVMCHRISGTSAGSNVGPDLTHIGSRRMIAANTLPNNTGNLAGWVLDPQSIKPGAHMPMNSLNPKDLEALVYYLKTLR